MKNNELDLRKHREKWLEFVNEENVHGQRLAIALSDLQVADPETARAAIFVHFRGVTRTLGHCVELSISDVESSNDTVVFVPESGLDNATGHQRRGLQCLTLQMQAMPSWSKEQTDLLLKVLSKENPSLQKVAFYANGVSQVMVRNPTDPDKWIDIGKVLFQMKPDCEHTKEGIPGVQHMARWLLQKKFGTEVGSGYPASPPRQEVKESSGYHASQRIEQPPPPVALFSHRRQHTDPGKIRAQHQHGCQSAPEGGSALPSAPQVGPVSEKAVRLRVEVQNVSAESSRRGISMPPQGLAMRGSPPSKVDKSVSPPSKVGKVRFPPRMPPRIPIGPVSTVASPSRAHSIERPPPHHRARPVFEAHGLPHERHTGIETSPPPPSQRHRDASSGRKVQPQTVQQAPWLTPNSDLSVLSPAMNTPCPTPAFQQAFQPPFQSSTMLNGAPRAVQGHLFMPGVVMLSPAVLAEPVSAQHQPQPFHDSTLR